MTKANILLTPGPTMVPQEALDVMAEPIFHHRTPQYRELFKEVSENLKLVFRTSQDVYTLTGSGTLAMEASVVNFLSPGDKVIVVEAGKFGERWSALAKRYQMNLVQLKAPYGKVVPAKELEKALKDNPDTKAVFATLCETSTGVLFDIEGMAKETSRTPAILVVDSISGLGADRLEMDEWGVDIVVTGSQKALMIPPGLAFIAISQKAWKLNETAKCLRYYADLGAYRKSLADWDTPWTPALTLVLALKQTLKMINSEGIETIWKRCARLAELTRSQMKSIGLTLFSKDWSNAVTAKSLFRRSVTKKGTRSPEDRVIWTEKFSEFVTLELSAKNILRV